MIEWNLLDEFGNVLPKAHKLDYQFLKLGAWKNMFILFIKDHTF